MAILGKERKQHSNENTENESTRKTTNKNQTISEAELLSDMAISSAFSVILLGGTFWSDPYRHMKASMAFPFCLADVNFSKFSADRGLLNNGQALLELNQTPTHFPHPRV